MMFESLESRTFLASTVNLVVSFYGRGGAGGFGNDWLDNIADKAGSETGSIVRKYDEDQGGQALKDTLRSIDTNHNRRIDKREINNLNLRVVGYSFGGVQAAEFARALAHQGDTIKGITLGGAIPIRAVVALDPVQFPVIKTTAGVVNNVYRFGDYYQQRGGDTTVDVYTQHISVKVKTITVDDPENIKGEALPTAARRSRAIRIDTEYADKSVKHQVESNLDGKIKGNKVNHGTVPFYAYDWALEDLTA